MSPSQHEARLGKAALPYGALLSDAATHPPPDPSRLSARYGGEGWLICGLAPTRLQRVRLGLLVLALCSVSLLSGRVGMLAGLLGLLFASPRLESERLRMLASVFGLGMPALDQARRIKRAARGQSDTEQRTDRRDLLAAELILDPPTLCSLDLLGAVRHPHVITAQHRLSRRDYPT